MNHSFLQAAKEILEKQAVENADSPYAALWSLGGSYCDPALARHWLQRAIAQAEHVFPLQGVALYQLYQQEKAQMSDVALLAAWYEAIVQQHRSWYARHDPAEEGLPQVPHTHVQDPLYLAMLVWSNECLMALGSQLKKDVLEIIQWNELTIYSMNEKLWDEVQHGYRLFDLQNNQSRETDFINRMAPLIGEIPTQNQAEEMAVIIRRYLQRSERLNVWEIWLLWQGLSRYDLEKTVAPLRKQLLHSIEEYGFYENFDTKSGAPMPDEPGGSALTAALALDFLKRC